MKRSLAVCAGIALVFYAGCVNPFFPPVKSSSATPEVPVISEHPQSAEYLIDKTAAALTVTASISGKGTLSYQWFQKNTEDPGEEAIPIPDATKDKYIPPTFTEGEMDYYVTVTNTLNKKTAAADSNPATISVYDTGDAALIDRIDVTITAPTKDGTPDTTAAVAGEGYTCGGVSWTPHHHAFQGNTAYTVTVTLIADDGHAFAPGLPATINQHEAKVVAYTINTVILSLEFDKTLNKAVTGISIKTQPAKLAYTYGDELDLSGLVVTLTYEDATSDDIPSVNFGTNILTSPKSGTELSAAHNGQPIAVSFGSLSPVYTAALAVKPPVVVIPSVSLEITHPVNGAAPANHAVGSNDEHFTVDSVSWNPGHDPFRGSTAYTVTAMLTARENYAFADQLTAAINNENATVAANTGATVRVSLRFAATDAKMVTRIEVINQPRFMAYTDGGALNLTSLTLRLIYDDATTESATYPADFLSKGIETEPEHDSTLSHSEHNKQPITVSYGGHETTTAPLIVVTWPTGLTTPYNKVLSNILLNAYTNDNTGSFAWSSPNRSVGIVGEHSDTMRFTPNDNTIYDFLYNDVGFTVYKADPDITFPTSASIIYGETLATAAFTGNNNDNVPGSFAYDYSLERPPATGPYSGYHVTFTPSDTANYNLLTLMVPFTVNRRPLAISLGRLNTGSGGSRWPSHYGGMIPFDSVGGADTVYAKTTTIPLIINSLAFEDTITVTPVDIELSTFGLTLTGNTDISASKGIPFSYNGTTVVTTTDPIPITFDISVVNYQYYTITINDVSVTASGSIVGSPIVNVNIFDGLAADRAIRVTNGNITAFNAYVNTNGSKHYKLAEPVVLTANWTQITQTFTGSFDGAGYTIENLIAPTDASFDRGMFDTIGGSGTVKNVGLINASITSHHAAAGGIAGINDGTVENCYVSGTVRNNGANDTYTGGIVGQNNGMVKNCYVTGTVYNIGNASAGGGIVGRNNTGGVVENCYATAEVKNISLDSGDSNSGGIVGRNYGRVQYCVALNSGIETSRNDAAANTAIGRVVGNNGGTLNNNYGHPLIPMTYDLSGASVSYTATPALAGKDGADLTDAYKTAAFWVGLQFSSDVWQWGANDLPILRTFAAPQVHEVSLD